MSEEDFKNMLEFTDEEMKVLMENPTNKQIISKAPDLMKKSIIVEVVKSHGCASRHRVGDKFYFTGDGNLLSKLCPSRICMSALNAAGDLVRGAVTLMWAGQDPNKMLFKLAGCSDVGLECGGWGNIAMEISVVDRDS
ncbi:hypothetical protein LCGC14_1706330 [marine sediment metagenome]|uniref:Uncharacterized protein n=1 Tax=marine sediment metagenome TaxID=412755 RepID=A0A0F9I450_9ZZZZ